MGSLAFVRRSLIGLAGTALGFFCLAAVARADASSTTGGVHAGIAIHGPEETLRDFCRTDAEGRLWLEVPGGARFELITSIDDPAISNPGDGSFHPFDEAEVRAALGQVRYAIGGVSADIFLLPFPRRGGLESAAAPGLILLSPGVRDVAREHQHYETVHELGHVVQYALMPDYDVERWKAYRALRGIDDETVYASTSAHANRPREIFAEDFRALFGGATATFSGTIENAALTPPHHVEGLAAFMESLVEGSPATIVLRATPSPSRGAVRLARAGGAGVPLDLFDLSGRRIATLPPVAVGGGWEWQWDGRDDAGRLQGAGVVFARARDGIGATARITRIP
jgi:hypothetical protein